MNYCNYKRRKADNTIIKEIDKNKYYTAMHNCSLTQHFDAFTTDAIATNATTMKDNAITTTTLTTTDFSNG